MKLREWLAINKVDVPKEKERSQGSPPYLKYNHGWNNSLSEILSLEVPEPMVGLDEEEVAITIFMDEIKQPRDCWELMQGYQREKFRSKAKSICSHFSQPRQAEVSYEELNKIIVRVFVDYKNTPMAIPDRIISAIHDHINGEKK